MTSGKLVSEHEAESPWAFRFMTRGLGTQETHSNGILSLLLFEPDYLKRLIQLGYHDAEAQMDQIDALLRDDEDTQEGFYRSGFTNVAVGPCSGAHSAARARYDKAVTAMASVVSMK